MAPHHVVDAQLQELYGQIPAIPDCTGQCWTSCGPIGMSDRERQRIRQAGIRVTPFQQAMASLETYWCEALTGDKRCAVYDLRPVVCRLWGAVEGMECVYGCVPEGGRWLSEMDGYRLIAEADRIGGGYHQFDDPARMDSAMARDVLRAEVERIRKRGAAGERNRMAHSVPAAFRRAGQKSD